MLTEGQTEQFTLQRNMMTIHHFTMKNSEQENRKEHTNKLRHISKYAAFNAIQRPATL